MRRLLYSILRASCLLIMLQGNLVAEESSKPFHEALQAFLLNNQIDIDHEGLEELLTQQSLQVEELTEDDISINACQFSDELESIVCVYDQRVLLDELVLEELYLEGYYYQDTEQALVFNKTEPLENEQFVSNFHIRSPHIRSPHIRSPHIRSPHIRSPHVRLPKITIPSLSELIDQLEELGRDVVCEPVGQAGANAYIAGAATMKTRHPFNSKKMNARFKKDLRSEFGSLVDEINLHFNSHLTDEIRFRVKLGTYDKKVSFSHGSNAITFGDHIYFDRTEAEVNLDLVAHEMVHVKQWADRGRSLYRFGRDYFNDFCKAKFSYASNVKEKSAYATQLRYQPIAPPAPPLPPSRPSPPPPSRPCPTCPAY